MRGEKRQKAKVTVSTVAKKRRLDYDCPKRDRKSTDKKSTDSYSTGTLNESAKNGKGGEKSNPS